uniref:Uncharacterized protein n=1 Tax=Populus trichocarpa TaxID=3694 RepID=A0A2K1Y612_POPTR
MLTIKYCPTGIRIFPIIDLISALNRNNASGNSSRVQIIKKPNFNFNPKWQEITLLTIKFLSVLKSKSKETL